MDSGLFSDQDEQETLPRAQDIDYNLDWPEEKVKRLARRLSHQIRQYLTATGPRRENCKRWRRMWDCMPEETPSSPHPDSSDIPASDTRRTCNAHHSRLNQQILLLDPPFAVVARDEAAVAAVPQIEEALPAFLDEAQWQVYGDDLHQELPKVGNCFLRMIYDVEERPKPFDEGEVDEDLAKALVMAGQDPMDAAFNALATDAEGRVKKELAFRQEVVFQGLRFKVVPWEDGIILPVTVKNAEHAHGIGERMMMMGEELRLGAKQGKYIKEAVDTLLRMPPDQIDDDFMEALEIQGIDAPIGDWEGDYTEDGDLEVSLYHQYLVWELCFRLDGNDDGYLEWCWVTIHPATDTILRLQYLPWKHGGPHYYHFPYLRRAGQLWGQGVAELIAGLADGRAAALNQHIDWADLAIRIATLILADDTSGLDPDEFEIELGKVIRVESINGIKQLVLPPLPEGHLMIPDMLKAEIDLLTGASDPVMGKEAAGQHTLGEIQIAVSAGNLHFENTAAAVARLWARLWDDARFLLAQYGEGEEMQYRKSPMPGARIQLDSNGQVMPPGMTQPGMPGMAQPVVPGMPTDPLAAMGMGAPAPVNPLEAPGPQFGTITSEMLRRRVDLVPAGLQHMSDIQTRIQQAQITYNTLMTNQMLAPLMMANPRLPLMILDYYLQQLRVPIRQQLLRELETTYNMLAAQASAAAAMQQTAAAGELDAATAGAEGQLKGEMANEGIAMPPANGNGALAMAG